MRLLGEQDFAASNHDSFDANSLLMVTLRQATSDRSGRAPWCNRGTAGRLNCGVHAAVGDTSAGDVPGDPTAPSVPHPPAPHACATTAAGSVRMPTVATPCRNPLRGPSASDLPARATGTQ